MAGIGNWNTPFLGQDLNPSFHYDNSAKYDKSADITPPYGEPMATPAGACEVSGL